MYHPNSEFARPVEQYVADFERSQGGTIELISLETREGAEMARLHDIVRYPAVLAIQQNGALASEWQGDKLPLMSEVASYYHR